MKRIFFLLALVLAASFCFSQSILWKVTGKKIKSPSYLYGTIHIQDKRVFAFDNTVTDAFNSCDAFAMEILMDEIDPKESQEATLMKDGKTLKTIMSAEDYKLLDSAFTAATGASLLLYNKMKPFFVSSAMMQAGMKQDMETALDLYFLQNARKAGKSCYGVEKFMDQINAIDAISLEDQVKMLMDGIKDTTSDGNNKEEEQFADLLDAYLTFNLDKALEMSSDPSLPAEFNQAFLINRNSGMAKNFLKIAKKQSLFCVVGAAHLPGEQGVISHLRKAGLTVEPVVFKWKEE
ncbi:MAG: TraB/GumN family protein [Bacteroidales bacterium]|nr:TraB/GumN family protein [Bacteroidales bacterium]